MTTQSMSHSPAGISVTGVTHFFSKPKSKEQVRALDNIDLQIDPGEFVAFVGPSGCGKTTLLNMIAGLLAPTHGEIRRSGQIVGGPDRDISYMLARSALMPWRSAQHNVELGLEIRGVPRAERHATSQALLKLTGLEEFANSYPSHLSQGMRQRVALARTLALDPGLILMDEPFAALDAQTKLVQQEEFVRIWEETKRTAILVTHDLAEAILMADRVIVFTARPGRIQSDFKIPLPRPRNLDDLRFNEEYRDLHERIWGHLKREVQGA